MYHELFWKEKRQNPKINLERRTNRALITRWWRIVSDLGWNSSRTKMGMNPKTKRGKWRMSIGGFCRTKGNHATWRRFQDKWGRSATLNRRFKDKDRWFWREPRDLREKLKFSYNSNLNTNVSHKGLYTMGQNTKRPNTTKGPMKPKQKHYKNI